MEQRGQAGIEYMIVVGFVTIAVITVLGISSYYSNITSDQIRVNQIQSFSAQLINHAESVYFAGEPSQVTVRLYVPEGINNITFVDTELIVSMRTSTGTNVQSYVSQVPLQGSVSGGAGTKTIVLRAYDDYVQVS